MSICRIDFGVFFNGIELDYSIDFDETFDCGLSEWVSDGVISCSVSESLSGANTMRLLGGNLWLPYLRIEGERERSDI